MIDEVPGRLPIRAGVGLGEAVGSMKSAAREISAALAPENRATGPATLPLIPEYLQQFYWWAYLHPAAVRLFEREWLINLILWGNYARLRDALLAEVEAGSAQDILQMACVYGDFSQRLGNRLGAGGRLDIIDVAPIQLANLSRKLKPDPRFHLHQQDAGALHFADASFDSTVLFFLLHEQPAAVRRATLAEAIRVTRPGGRVLIVDYHRPRPMHPLRYLMQGVLKVLEPFALDLWGQEIAAFLPRGWTPVSLEKTTAFGGLYQKIVLEV